MVGDLLVYEDSSLLVLNKPSGMHSLPGKSDAPVVASLVLEHFPEQSTVSPVAAEAGLLQRLDFETSGCLLVARSRDTWQALHLQLTSGLMKKTYLLLAEGLVTRGEVHTSIGSRYRGSKKVSVYPLTKDRARSQPAQTFFELLDQPKPLVSLARATTTTGRRHQVRAHAAHHGNPLVGDTLYGARHSLQDFPGLLGPEPIPPFFLHAESIRFMHPETKQEMVVEAPVPAYCCALLSSK